MSPYRHILELKIGQQWILNPRLGELPICPECHTSGYNNEDLKWLKANAGKKFKALAVGAFFMHCDECLYDWSSDGFVTLDGRLSGKHALIVPAPWLEPVNKLTIGVGRIF